MAEASTQNLSNYTRYDPLFHFFILPVFAITLIITIVHLIKMAGTAFRLARRGYDRGHRRHFQNSALCSQSTRPRDPSGGEAAPCEPLGSSDPSSHFGADRITARGLTLCIG